MSKETRAFKKGRGAHRTYIPGDPALGAQLDQALKRMGLRNFPDEGKGIVRGRNITEVKGVDPVKADQIYLKRWEGVISTTVQKGLEEVKEKSQSNLSFNANLKAVIAEI